MSNFALLKAVTFSDIESMGFRMNNYDNGDVDYSIESSNFKVSIDPWFEVTLCRKDVPSDPIVIQCEDKSDLEGVLGWIAD